MMGGESGRNRAGTGGGGTGLRRMEEEEDVGLEFPPEDVFPGADSLSSCCWSSFASSSSVMGAPVSTAGRTSIGPGLEFVPSRNLLSLLGLNEKSPLLG